MIELVKSGSKVLMFDYSQFQANASVVYPAGTMIYFVKSTGQITGVHKIADGVNTLANLRTYIEDYNVFNGIRAYESPDFIAIKNSSAGQIYADNKFSGVSYTNSSPVGLIRWYPLLIDKPILLNEVGVSVTSFTSSGVIYVGIYSVDSSTFSGTLITGSNGTINITSTGIMTASYSNLYLEPNLYYIATAAPSGSGTYNINIQNNNNIRGINISTYTEYNAGSSSFSGSGAPASLGALHTNTAKHVIFFKFSNAI